MILAVLIIVTIAIGLFMIGNLLRRKRNTTHIISSMDNLFKERYELFEQIKSSTLFQSTEENNIAALNNLFEQMKSDDLNTEEKVAIENRTSERIYNVLKSFQDDTAYTEIDKLQSLWNAAELRFADARNAYNNSVIYYNYSITSFPTKYLAKLLDYMPKASLNEFSDTNSIVEDLIE